MSQRASRRDQDGNRQRIPMSPEQILEREARALSENERVAIFNDMSRAYEQEMAAATAPVADDGGSGGGGLGNVISLLFGAIAVVGSAYLIYRYWPRGGGSASAPSVAKEAAKASSSAINEDEIQALAKMILAENK